jgi:hypothetical protein
MWARRYHIISTYKKIILIELRSSKAVTLPEKGQLAYLARKKRT